MAAVREFTDFRKKGQGVIPVVTAVKTEAIDGFLSARNEQERLAHLRGLRDTGILVHQKGALTQLVVEPDSSWRGRCYVFRGEAWTVPRIKRRRRVHAVAL